MKFFCIDCLVHRGKSITVSQEKSLNWMKNKEKETSCFISAKEQNYHEQRPESILWELVLERESQLPYLSYDEHIAEELRGCTATIFSSGCFIFFFLLLLFWLLGLLDCSTGMQECSNNIFRGLILKNPQHHKFILRC